MSNSMPPQNAHLISKMLYASGFIFAVLGAICLALPQALDGFVDRDTGRLIAGSLLFIGVSDFVIARFVFDKVKTK